MDDKTKEVMRLMDKKHDKDFAILVHVIIVLAIAVFAPSDWLWVKIGGIAFYLFYIGGLLQASNKYSEDIDKALKDLSETTAETDIISRL